MSELKQIFKLNEAFPKISTGLLDSNRNQLFTGHFNGLVILWEKISNSPQYKSICKLNGEISSIEFLNENNIIISNTEGELIIFNLINKTSEILEPATFNKYNRKFRVLKLNEKSFLSSGTYGKLLLWKKVKRKWNSVDIYPYRDTCFGLAKLNNQFFASGDYRGRLNFWKMENGVPKRLQELYIGYNIKQINWVENDCLVVLGRDGTFSYLEKEDSSDKFKVRKEFSIFFGLGMDIAFSTKKKHILASTSSQIILYDIELDLIKKLDVKYCKNLYPYNDGIYILTENSLEYIDLTKIDVEVEKIEFKYHKISLIGDTGVGKSTLCNLLTESKLSKIYSTIGKKTWNWDLREEEEYSRRIFLHDLGGQKTALSTSLHYTLDSDIIIVLFKQTQEATFRSSLELISHLNEINKDFNIYLLQTFADQPNNDVEFIDFKGIIASHSINEFSVYSFDDNESLKLVKEKLLNLISWEDSKIVVQSKVVTDIIKVLNELKSNEDVTSISLNDFKGSLHESIEITEPHLRYILKNLNDQGIIDYFPKILDVIIFNEEDYEQLKMKIPRWAKANQGIFAFTDLLKELTDGDVLKSKYVKIIDQIYQSFEYNIQIGTKRVFPSSLFLKKESIKLHKEFKVNKKNKIKWKIQSDKFPLFEFLNHLKEYNYFCKDISTNNGLFYLSGNSVYFYYNYSIMEAQDPFEESENKIIFEVIIGGNSPHLFPKSIRNIENILNFIFNDKVTRLNENFFFLPQKKEFELKRQKNSTYKSTAPITIDNNKKSENSGEHIESEGNLISFEEFIEKSELINFEDNIDLEENSKIHTVFISYSHDSDDLENWVKNFATKLIEEAGINAILDKWDLNFGNWISKFMEQIKVVDRIIIVCSSLYKEKADEQIGGGVAYEKALIADEIIRGNSEKIIPITPFSYKENTPNFLSDMYIAEFNDENYEKIFKQVVLNIYGKPKITKPILGKKLG